MAEPYVPISCAIHDKLLDLAVRRESADLTIGNDDGKERLVTGVIADVFSREGAEFLRLADGDLIRLDTIARLNGEEVLPA